jgi:hypothetical protein
VHRGSNESSSPTSVGNTCCVSRFTCDFLHSILCHDGSWTTDLFNDTEVHSLMINMTLDAKDTKYSGATDHIFELVNDERTKNDLNDPCLFSSKVSFYVYLLFPTSINDTDMVISVTTTDELCVHLISLVFRKLRFRNRQWKEGVFQ